MIILTFITRAIHVGGSDDFNVVFIGAGNIMFGESSVIRATSDHDHSCIVIGSDEGPWNHSFRFEQSDL